MEHLNAGKRSARTRGVVLRAGSPRQARAPKMHVTSRRVQSAVQRGSPTGGLDTAAPEASLRFVD